MNNNRNISILILIVLYLVHIPCTVSAEPVHGFETVLFTLSGEPFHITLEGDQLYWIQDNKHLNASERGLFSYGISRGMKRHLVKIGVQRDIGSDHTVPSVHQLGSPRISGGYVVFNEKGIMMTNISTGYTVQLTNRGDASLPVSDIRFNQNAWIDGDKLVWTEHEGLAHSDLDGGKIVILNLTTEDRLYLPIGSPGNQSTPMISGDLILWKDYRHGGIDDPDLYLFDMRTGKEERLPTDYPLESKPYISGDDVVWTEEIHGIHTIVHYSVSSGARTIIGQGNVHQGHIPPISDNRVVWLQSMNPLDFRESRCAIMMMDFSTGEKSQLTSFQRGLSHPVVSGKNVVYTRGAGDDWFGESREVMLYTLSSRTEEAAVDTGTGPGISLSSPSGNDSPNQGEMVHPTSSPGFAGTTLIAGCIAALAYCKVRG